MGTSAQPATRSLLLPSFGGDEGRLQRWNDALNPILVMELRQLWNSRQFVIIFFVLLATAWAVCGLALSAPETILQYVPFGYSPTGQISGAALFFVLYASLVIALNFAVPLRAIDSLAHEFSRDTMEMIVLTRIPSDRVAVGKFWCAVLHMILYFAALSPFVAVTYLLTGIDLLTIAVLLVSAFAISAGLCSLALMLGSYCRTSTVRPVLTIVLLATSALVTWGWLVLVYNMLQFGGMGFGRLAGGTICLFIPWLSATAACLGTAVRRVRPKSPHVDRIQYVGPESLVRICKAVMKFTETVRTEFPVVYDEAPPDPPPSKKFREAHDQVLRLAGQVEWMFNRYRRPFDVVVKNLPLAPPEVRKQFAGLRQRFYGVVQFYGWMGLCSDSPFVPIRSSRFQVPAIELRRLDELDAAARELITACATIGRDTPEHHRRPPTPAIERLGGDG